MFWRWLERVLTRLACAVHGHSWGSWVERWDYGERWQERRCYRCFAYDQETIDG